MKRLAILLTTLVIVTACTFDPVRPQAVYEATATARSAEATAQAMLPTVTPTPVPPLPTVEPAVVPPTVEATPECVVKGNINARGEKIYHLPGDPNYVRTKAEECFPDAASAEAAGYRPIKK